VYDLNQIDRTKHYLLKYTDKPIAENEYQTLIENYYAERFNHPIDDTSRVIWEQGIRALQFDVIGQFQLIEKIGEVADIFVEWDDEATRLADCYAELKEIKKHYNLEIFKDLIPDAELDRLDSELTFHQRKALLKVILNKMGNYIIQIRYERFRKNRPMSFKDRLLKGVEAPFYWVPGEDMDRYYNPRTGFMDESGEAYVI
jgi:CRISPR-associated endonuclease/helicase Cas3